MSIATSVISGVHKVLPQAVQATVSNIMLKCAEEIYNPKIQYNITYKGDKLNIPDRNVFRTKFEEISVKNDVYEFLSIPINNDVHLLGVLQSHAEAVLKTDGLTEEVKAEWMNIKENITGRIGILNEVMYQIKAIVSEKFDALTKLKDTEGKCTRRKNKIKETRSELRTSEARCTDLEKENKGFKDKNFELEGTNRYLNDKCARRKNKIDALKDKNVKLEADYRALKSNYESALLASRKYARLNAEFAVFEKALRRITSKNLSENTLGNILYSTIIELINILDEMTDTYMCVPYHRRPYASIVVSNIKEYMKESILKYMKERFPKDYKNYADVKDDTKNGYLKKIEVYKQLLTKVPDSVKFEMFLISAVSVLSGGNGSAFQDFFKLFKHDVGQKGSNTTKYNTYIRKLGALSMSGSMYSFIAFGPDNYFKQSLVGVKVGSTDLHIQIRNGTPLQFVYGLMERVCDTYFMDTNEDLYNSVISVIEFTTRMLNFTRSFLLKEDDREALGTDLCILPEDGIYGLFGQYPELMIDVTRSRKSLASIHLENRLVLGKKLNDLNEKYGLPTHECPTLTIEYIIKEIYGYRKDRPKKGFKYNINRSTGLLQCSAKVNDKYKWKGNANADFYKVRNGITSSEKIKKYNIGCRNECAISQAIRDEKGNIEYSAPETLIALLYRALIQSLYSGIAPYVPMILSTSIANKVYEFKSFEEREQYIKDMEVRINEILLQIYEQILQVCKKDEKGKFIIPEFIDTEFFLNKVCNGVGFETLFDGSVFATESPEYKKVLELHQKLLDLNEKKASKKEITDAKKEYQKALLALMETLPCCNSTYAGHLLEAFGEKKSEIIGFLNECLI